MISRRTRRASISALAATLVLLLVSPPAVHPWGAFLGVAGLHATDTHQQIMRAAYSLLMNDPRIKGMVGLPIAGGLCAFIDQILEYEGVYGSIRTLKPYGPGPDAEGATLYSCHYFNPLTGKGMAPQSAADWYSRFMQAILGISGRNEDALKGLAWSAHFLADMFVPYHTIGIPAGEAVARLSARNFTMSEAESGPTFLWQPAPPQTMPGTVLGDASRAYDKWKQDGWGLNSNFREPLAIFGPNHQAAGAGESVNHLDWFDPWYWNGKSIAWGGPLSDSNTDPGLSIFSTHVSYEEMAHSRFLESGGYGTFPNGVLRYDPLWKNAPPDYAFSGMAWQAQSWQVQDFVAKVALRTRQNAEAYWKTPETAVRGAVEAVYTMWRSAYSALHPMIQAGRDPSRPNDGLVITANVQNIAWESCHNVSVRLRLGKGGSTVFENVQMLPQVIAGSGTGAQSWFAQVNPNEEWTVIVEAVGVYDKTPDLQYSMSYAQYKPDPSQAQVKRVEEANTADFVGSFIHTDPQRTYEQYHGEMILQANGTFTDVETLTNGTDVRRGQGVWRFDPATMTVTIDWQPGGQFSGPVSGNTADFTINGQWSNGGSGTLRFQRR